MKTGSVIQLESPKTIDDVPSPVDIFVKVLPKMGVDYTIETVTKCDCCGEHYVTLDQIPNPGRFPGGRIIPYPASWFVELVDPLAQFVKEEKTEVV